VRSYPVIPRSDNNRSAQGSPVDGQATAVGGLQGRLPATRLSFSSLSWTWLGESERKEEQKRGKQGSTRIRREKRFRGGQNGTEEQTERTRVGE